MNPRTNIIEMRKLAYLKHWLTPVPGFCAYGIYKH